MSYERVADNAELDPGTRERFLTYMHYRWPKVEDESRMSRDGYAFQWAMRFKEGVEYQASDDEGRRILQVLWRERTGSEEMA